MKLGWGLLTQPDKLWVQILKGKYVKDKGHPPVVITKPNASPLQKKYGLWFFKDADGLQVTVGQRGFGLTHGWKIKDHLFTINQVHEGAVNLCVAAYSSECGWNWSAFQMFRSCLIIFVY